MAQIQVVDLLSEVALICRSCPMQVMTQAYVRAARILCKHSKWFRATITGSTVANQALYSLGSDTYNEIVSLPAISLTKSATNIYPLVETSSTGWDVNDAAAPPKEYQYVPEGQFAIHPKPDAVYAMTAAVALAPKRGSNSLDDTLVVHWDYAFQSGALAYLLAMPNVPWANLPDAQRMDAKFTDWQNRAASATARRDKQNTVPWT